MTPAEMYEMKQLSFFEHVYWYLFTPGVGMARVPIARACCVEGRWTMSLFGGICLLRGIGPQTMSLDVVPGPSRGNRCVGHRAGRALTPHLCAAASSECKPGCLVEGGWGSRRRFVVEVYGRGTIAAGLHTLPSAG